MKASYATWHEHKFFDFSNFFFDFLIKIEFVKNINGELIVFIGKEKMVHINVAQIVYNLRICGHLCQHKKIKSLKIGISISWTNVGLNGF